MLEFRKQRLKIGPLLFINMNFNKVNVMKIILGPNKDGDKT